MEGPILTENITKDEEENTENEKVKIETLYIPPRRLYETGFRDPRRWPIPEATKPKFKDIVKYYRRAKATHAVLLPGFLDRFYSKAKERRLLDGDNQSEIRANILDLYVSHPPDEMIHFLGMMEHSPLLYYAILRMFYKNMDSDQGPNSKRGDWRRERAIVECCQIAISMVYERALHIRVKNRIKWEAIFRAAEECQCLPPNVIEAAKNRAEERETRIREVRLASSALKDN